MVLFVCLCFLKFECVAGLMATNFIAKNTYRERFANRILNF